MYLIDDAVILEILGIRMYAFGVYIALGTLCAMAVIGVMARYRNLKPGTASLTALLSAVCGIAVSRLAFCLLNQDLNMFDYMHAWPQLSGGGWSMFGLIGGVYLGGWISAKITKERTGRIFDVLSLALLPLMAAERIGESRIDDFDVSRALDSEVMKNSFLAVHEDEPVLATYYVAAFMMVVLFVALLIRACRKYEQDGNLTVVFLLVFGAASIILESLRYDFFLSISFVGLQQVAAALTLGLGVILAAKRSNRPKSALAIAAYISLPLMVGAVIGLEFALDRTNWNKILVYAVMIITVCIPAVLGLKLLDKGNREE